MQMVIGGEPGGGARVARDNAYLDGAKDVALTCLEVARHNVLLSIRGVAAETVGRRIAVREEANSISWIVGHLAQQLERHFLRWCQGIQVLADEEMRPFLFGASKAVAREARLPFRDVVEYFQKVSDASLQYLKALPAEGFRRVPEARLSSGQQNANTILELVERNALHLLGHAGQIFMIRRLLGDYGSDTFVRGMTTEERAKGRQEWDGWWAENRDRFR